ncbi:hypothetical protein [Sneathiella sp.]|jgi:hypothetical protein|uniref:hypothetical protein n=1 Tax=Sneathiella sp. TaxID=1964365 RepID=UPI0039E4E34A
MKKFIVFFTVFIAACNTTNNTTVDLSNVDTTNPYLVGFYVKYSEICAQFRGSGANNLSIHALKQQYQQNARFKKGYAVNNGTEGFDAVTNLDHCDLAKAVVNKASKYQKIS